jgi:hypothetical protein
MWLIIPGNATYNCSDAFGWWHGPGYLHERDFCGWLFCSLAAEESRQWVVFGVVNDHCGLEDGFMRRALFDGMVLWGRKASFLHILLEAALEYVAILNPCGKIKHTTAKNRSFELIWNLELLNVLAALVISS